MVSRSFHLMALSIALLSQVWGQSNPLEGSELYISQKGVQFKIVPALFERVVSCLENTSDPARFFIEDSRSHHHYTGTITGMEMLTADNYVVFNGKLDNPLPLIDKEMKVYLDLNPIS